MARARLIDAGLWRSENVATLPYAGRPLLIGLVTGADDQGRGRAHPALLRSQIFPYDDVSLDEVTGWLQQLHRVATITLYEQDSRSYYQLVNWWKFQTLDYAAPSDFPAPPGWTDRIRKTVTKGFIATFNWTRTDGERVQDTCDQKGRPLPRCSSQTPGETNGAGQRLEDGCKTAGIISLL